MNYFKHQQAKLKTYLKQVVVSNRKGWQKTHPWAKDALTRLESYTTRGKMIRGLLVLLAAGPKYYQQAKPVAAAMELMHSGILIHDDIMDRDLKRRGLPTIHFQYKDLSSASQNSERLHYGESMAISVGIIAYFLAMGELAKVKSNQGLLALFSEEMSVLGAGQMEDVDTATHSHKLTEKSALRVYEQKTGRYTFAVPLLAGLMIARQVTPQVKKKVLALSRELGIMFQLQDDILGLVGDTKKTGKSVGGDLRERKKTWLYFRLLKSVDSKTRRKLEKFYNQGKALNKTQQTWVMNLMLGQGIIERAQQKLIDQHQIASEMLLDLPFNRDQTIVMQSLIDYLVTREK